MFHGNVSRQSAAEMFHENVSRSLPGFQEMTKMAEKTLYTQLLDYCKTDAYPFHMPGHKRRLGSMADPFSFDITEIEGFDNLHHAEGILKEAQERAADLYHAKEAFYLVNGSTAGILAAVSAALSGERAAFRGGHAQTGKKQEPVILCARNVHKAACHALYLNRARPVWLFPDMQGEINGKVQPAQVRRALEQYPDARAVFITSPTYDGIVSDIRALAQIAHEAGIPLIVDQAHGAHFGLHPDLPESAVTQGADLVITSLHKTLPSLTQTGLLLLGGNLISPEKLRRFLAIYQTSSPSYVLMAGMDACVGMMKRDAERIFGDLLANISRFRERVCALKYISLLQTDDPTRLLVSAGDRLSGAAICGILRKRFHIEAEMELPGYVLCLCGAGDDADGFERLCRALVWIDAWIDAQIPDEKSRMNPVVLQKRMAEAFTAEPEQVVPLYEAWDADAQPVPLHACAGRISGEFAYLYPPGMPLTIPGERIKPETAVLLAQAGQAGYGISGMADLSGKTIRVLR